MADFHDENAHRLILNTDDNPPIAHAIPPHRERKPTLERCAHAARIVQRGDPFAEEAGDSPGNSLVESP